MIEKQYEEMAPCLQSGPITVSANAFVESALSLGNTRFASIMRALCVPYIFGELEKIFASGTDPVEGLNRILQELTNFLKTAPQAQFSALVASGSTNQEETISGSVQDIEKITGSHYGNLFRNFSDKSYWQEPTQLLKTRLERNGINLNRLADCLVLDAGCGGGRYTVAWKQLGAASVIGVDISDIGIADAEKRVEIAGIRGVTFRAENVLSLSFPDNTFDVVFSNGVLHHSTDWKQGIRELVRVLRPGGWGWLYLIENPGGLFWDSIEILRVVMRGEDRNFAQQVLALLGIPANRVFYMLDHVMVPINIRLTTAEIEDALQAAGAVKIRRLERGVDFDRVEQLFQRVPYASLKFGIGENRYVFSKPV
ncbi:MAG TPA: class I SAM-dependent methyltransferase [Bacteroidales bacterium]|nr:class I SAM-dependent methyltransferase [Bacteroidales bacterium]